MDFAIIIYYVIIVIPIVQYLHTSKIILVVTAKYGEIYLAVFNWTTMSKLSGS